MVALSIGGFSRILVDLVDLPVDFSVDFLVLVSQGCLSVGFNLSVGLDRVDTAISPFSNICCHIYIDCQLPSWLGCSVIIISVI